MLIPKVLKEGQDPPRTAKGKVTVIAYHDSALIQPWILLTLSPAFRSLICSGSSAKRKSRFHRLHRLQSHLSLLCLKSHLTSPCLLPLVMFYLLCIIPTPLAFCLLLHIYAHSSPPFLSSYCSKTTLCCYHQILHSHSVVSGSSLHLIPSRQVSSPIHLPSR